MSGSTDGAGGPEFPVDDRETTAEDGPADELGRAGRVAALGPYALLAAFLVLGVGAALVARFVGPVLPRPWGGVAVLGGLGLALVTYAAALLFQAAFVVRNPETAAEHGVAPPTKLDVRVEDAGDAGRVAAFGAAAGLLCLVAGGYALWTLRSAF